METESHPKLGRDAVLTHGVLTKNPEELFYSTGWRVPWAVLREASLRLWSDDAFGLAGNIAYRALLAVFPFLIFTSALTAFIGGQSMADGLAGFLIAIVPQELAEPIISEVVQVMTVQRGGVLSVGILLTIWFAVGGVDGVRVGLNRAYGIRETRSAFVLYSLQVAVVILAGLVLSLVAYLLVLAPLLASILHAVIPGFDPASVTIGLIRYPVTMVILMATLFMAHLILPARRLAFAYIWPGVVFTLTLWTILAVAFSSYLVGFGNFSSFYAGLAGIVATLYFLYLAALILIYGGECNRALRIRHLAQSLHQRGDRSRHSETGRAT